MVERESEDVEQSQGHEGLLSVQMVVPVRQNIGRERCQIHLRCHEKYSHMIYWTEAVTRKALWAPICLFLSVRIYYVANIARYACIAIDNTAVEQVKIVK